MIRGKGLHRPDPAKHALRAHATQHPALRSSVEPTWAADLNAGPQLNQKSASICHAYSAAGVIWTALNASGSSLIYTPSPKMIASFTYADVQGPADKRGPLQDTGADLNDDEHAIESWGVSAIRPTSIDDGICDCDDLPGDGTFPEPDASQLVISGHEIVRGAYTIPVDENAPTLIAQALDAGIPIWFGGPVNNLYESLPPNGVATAACVAGGSGHAQFLRKCYKTASGDHRYRIRGSWGHGFADNGEVDCDDSYIFSQWMLYLGAYKLVAS